MFAQLRSRLEILRSAYANWSAILGTIIATVALCNLIFRVMHASLAEAFEWVLSAYQKTFIPQSTTRSRFSRFIFRLPVKIYWYSIWPRAAFSIGRCRTTEPLH